MADSTGRELTFGRALVGSLLLARAIRRHVPRRHVHRPAPARVGRRRPRQHRRVDRRPRPGQPELHRRPRRDGGGHRPLRHHDRADLAHVPREGRHPGRAGHAVPRGRPAGRHRRCRRLATLAAARLLPASLVERAASCAPADPDALATIIFSSGSTGVPKGVMLTHRNVLANIDGANALFRLGADDVVLGVLPFFHSFGYTVTLWLPLVVGFGAAYHPEPDRREDDRRAGREVRRDAADQHADVLLRVRAQVPARTVRAPAARDRRRRAAARADRGGVQGEVRRRSDRRLRLHGDGAGRRGQRAGRRPAPARAPAPSAVRCRASRRRSSIPTPAKGRSSARRGCCSSPGRTRCAAISANPS